MPINKVKYRNNTLIDLTDTTATASEVLSGYSFHDKTGALVQGSKTIDLTTVTVTPTNTTQVIAPGDEYYLNIENMAPTYAYMDTGSIWNISWSSQLNAGEIYHITLDFYRAGYTRHYAYDDDITFNGFPFNITARSTNSSHTAIMKFNTTQITNALAGDDDNLTANRLTVSVFKESTAIGFSQVTVNGDADLLSSNIKKGVNIFGVAGTYEAGSTPTYQTKTVSPTESQQTVSPDSGYDALSSVTVNAISSSYVGSGIDRRSSSDLTGDYGTSAAGKYTVTAPSGYYESNATYSLTSKGTSNITTSTSGGNLTVTWEQGFYGGGGKTIATVKDSGDLTVSGATVTVPAGYYATAASASVASGSASTPATSITANPTISVSSSGLITASVSASKNVTPTVSAGYVSSGTAGTVSVSGSKTQQLTTKAAATITPGTTNQTIAAGTYLTGTQTIAGDADLVAGNIKSGVQIFGVTGNLSFITYYTGSSTPSSSLGSNGDIYLKVA